MKTEQKNPLNLLNHSEDTDSRCDSAKVNVAFGYAEGGSMKLSTISTLKGVFEQSCPEARLSVPKTGGASGKIIKFKMSVVAQKTCIMTEKTQRSQLNTKQRYDIKTH